MKDSTRMELLRLLKNSHDRGDKLIEVAWKCRRFLWPEQFFAFILDAGNADKFPNWVKEYNESMNKNK